MSKQSFRINLNFHYDHYGILFHLFFYLLHNISLRFRNINEITAICNACNVCVYAQLLFLPNFVLCFGVVENILLAKLGANEYLLPSGGNPIKIPLNRITLFENTFVSPANAKIHFYCLYCILSE